MMRAVELKAQQKQAALRSGVAFALSIFCLVVAAIGLPTLLSFPTGQIESVLFACRLNVIAGLILLASIRFVANIRFHSIEDNRGSAFDPPSRRLAIPAAFLQNTLEQCLLLVIANFALAAIGTQASLAYMTMAIVLFAVGRVSFFMGYRHGSGGRAFGMVMTMTPAIGGLVWSLADIVF